MKPVSGVGWVLGVITGIGIISLVPAKYKWFPVLIIALSGLAWFENNKRRGPLESLATATKGL
jgi:hypothetical protein